jgi:hypothetical protein
MKNRPRQRLRGSNICRGWLFSFVQGGGGENANAGLPVAEQEETNEDEDRPLITVRRQKFPWGPFDRRRERRVHGAPRFPAGRSTIA